MSVTTPVMVQIADRSVPLSMPRLMPASEVLAAWTAEGDSDARQPMINRAAYAALGLCWAGATPPGWPDYHESGCDPLIYGEAVHECLYRAGAPVKDLGRAAGLALDLLANRFPSDADREAARDFFGAPGGAGSSSGPDGAEETSSPPSE